MRDFTKRHGGALILIPLLTLIHMIGAASVPFHPDESSYLFQSRDLEIWLTHPLDLVWQPGSTPDDPQGYRSLNSPLSKYVLGAGRRLAGYGPQAVSVDWDWTQDWVANIRAGAMPDSRLLLGARLASSALIALTLLFIYKVGIEISGRWTGLLAVGLVGTNALVLLHARRAMAEGTLLMAASMALWGITVAGRRPWIAGIGSALAFAAKQSAAPLALVGLASAVWPRSGRRASGQWKHTLRFLLTAVVFTVVMQPFFWAHPLGAAKAMLDARRTLLSSQIETIRDVAPGRVLDSPLERAAAMIGEVFIVPPQVSEVGNYLEQTAVQDRAYLDNPFHRVLRGFAAGGVLFGLALVGLVLSFWPGGEAGDGQRMARRWLGVAGLAEVAALLLANPLPFQRYYLPLIPFVALWVAFGVTSLTRAMQLLARRRHPPAA